MFEAAESEDAASGTAGYPQIAGAAAAVARKAGRRLPGSASAPTLPPVMSPGKPPTPPLHCSGMTSPLHCMTSPGRPALGDRARRKSFGTSEACQMAEDNHRSSPVAHAGGKSPSESPNSTPRTPRSVEVRVEGQELVVPGGLWGSDGQLELLVSENLCTVTVKTGLSGRSGLSVVLRVGLALEGVADNCLRLSPNSEALSTWTTVQVAGAEECDMGRLPSRPGSLPKAPQPGQCRHEWSDGSSSRCGEVSAQEAVVLGPSGVSCNEFYCGLSLDVSASCVVTPQGHAKLRVEVRGELRLLPRFFPAGREGVARLYKAARDSFRTGEDSKALQKCEEAVTMADALVPRPREMGDVLNLMGAVYLRRRNPALAAKCLERALLVREMLGGCEDLGMAATLNTLGNAKHTLCAFAEALRCHERAYAILKKMAVPADAAIASCLQSLGGIHRALGNLGDAKECFEEVIAIREPVLNANDPLLAGTFNNLGAVLQGLADDRGAIQYYQKALGILIQVHGRDHPRVAATLSNLGSAHGRLGEHQSALDCHQRALSIQEDHLGLEDVAVATSLHNLGNGLALAGHGSEAARCLWRALAIWSKQATPSQCDIAATLHSLGNVYRGLGDGAAAMRCFAGALRIREKVLGATHQETARTRHCAALVSCKQGDESSGLQELEVAASSLLSSLGTKHPWSMKARADVEALRQAHGGC